MTLRSDADIIEFSSRVPGFYGVDELQQLLAHVRSLPKQSTIVEIGVECGRSASVILQCPENWSELHLIDARTHNAVDGRRWTSRLLGTFQAWCPEPVPWIGGKPQAGYEHLTNFQEPYDPWPHFKPPSNDTHQPNGWRPRSMGCDAMPNNMIYDRENTSEAEYQNGWCNEPAATIDLLHIDGDHGEGVWRDCELWLQKVRIGGIVVFHDYMRRGADGTGDVFPEVTKAANHHVLATGQWQPLLVVDTQLAARRIE